MTRTWITRWISGAALAASLSAAAHAEPLDNWLGDWTNSSSSGVVGVEITLTDGALKISAEGSCSPNPCQWGEVDAFAHAPSPAVNPTADTEAILAVWDKGFSVTTMILNRTESGKPIHRPYRKLYRLWVKSTPIRRRRKPCWMMLISMWKNGCPKNWPRNFPIRKTGPL